MLTPNPPQSVKNLEDVLSLLESWLSSLGLELDTEGVTFEQRTEAILTVLLDNLPENTIVRPMRPRNEFPFY